MAVPPPSRRAAGHGAVRGRGAWVVHPEIRSDSGAPTPACTGKRTPEARLEEAVGLARAVAPVIGVAEIWVVRRARPSALFGTGQLAIFAERLDSAPERPELVVVNCTLSPVQQRNLERRWRVKILDRTALILEIFGARARTREGRLQVELAALSYQRSRLVRSWTHLERQRGGLGFVGGPGESQLEVDRRRIDERIAHLKHRLGSVARTRGLHRSARRRVPHPVVTLIGYTNSGKSTLFNRLTGAAVTARDRLFATLDPTMRSLALESGRSVILSDTVGFVADLPTELVTAFRATLEEVIEADVIVHVRDAAHPESDAQSGDVMKVLADLGIAAHAGQRPIVVHNKIDLLECEARAALRVRLAGCPDEIAASARDGTGLESLRNRIDSRLALGREVAVFDLQAADGAALSWLYRHGEVLSRDHSDGTVRVRVAMEPADSSRFARLFLERQGRK